MADSTEDPKRTYCRLVDSSRDQSSGLFLYPSGSDGLIASGDRIMWSNLDGITAYDSKKLVQAWVLSGDSFCEASAESFGGTSMVCDGEHLFLFSLIRCSAGPGHCLLSRHRLADGGVDWQVRLDTYPRGMMVSNEHVLLFGKDQMFTYAKRDGAPGMAVTHKFPYPNLVQMVMLNGSVLVPLEKGIGVIS